MCKFFVPASVLRDLAVRDMAVEFSGVGCGDPVGLFPTRFDGREVHYLPVTSLRVASVLLGRFKATRDDAVMECINELRRGWEMLPSCVRSRLVHGCGGDPAVGIELTFQLCGGSLEGLQVEYLITGLGVSVSAVRRAFVLCGLDDVLLASFGLEVAA